MRKYSRKYILAVVMCAVLVCMALCWDHLEDDLRIVLMAMASAVACVWIWCESRIDRAAAPLNLPEDLVPQKYKPPEETDE